MKKKLFFISLIFSFFCSPVFADQEKAYVQIQAGEMKKVFAGQRVGFYVTLFAQSRFTGSPKFNSPEIPGLIIMEVEDRPVLGSTKEGGIEYLTKTHEFAVFPQKDGKFTIPSFAVTFAFVDISANKEIEKGYQTNEINFSVQRPPGTDAVENFISTIDFSVKETWDPQPQTPKVGDAFKRTITRTAKDIPGMVHLPIAPNKIDGLGTYPDPPRIQDNMQRGEFTGTRTEVITYVCEAQGRFEIPELKFHWFDLSANALKEKVLPAVTFNVAPNPQPLLNEDADADQNNLKTKWINPERSIAFGCFMLLAFIGFRYRTKMTIAWQRFKKKKAMSEKAFFKKFRTACHGSDNIVILNAFTDWLDCLFPDQHTVPVKSILVSFEQTKLLNEFMSLEKRLYGPDEGQGSGSCRTLFAYAIKFRKKIKQQQHKKIIADQGLKALNP